MSRTFKVLLGVLGGAVLVLVVLTTVFAGSGLFGSGSMMGQGGMMDGGWGVFGTGSMMLGLLLVPLLFLGGLIAVIIWAVTQLGSGGPQRGMPPVVREFTNTRARRYSSSASLGAK